MFWAIVGMGAKILDGRLVADELLARVAQDGTSRIVGDSDFESCREIAGRITLVPGGVGPVTVAMLMRNTVYAAKRLKSHYEAQFAST